MDWEHTYQNFDSPQHALVTGIVMGALMKSSALEEGEEEEKLIHNVRPIINEEGYTKKILIDSGNETWVITIDPQEEEDG